MKTATPSQARWALGATFLLHGILIGSWEPHIPLAKERLDVGPAVFGGMLAASMVGIFLIPMLYVVMQWFREKVHGTAG